MLLYVVLFYVVVCCCYRMLLLLLLLFYFILFYVILFYFTSFYSHFSFFTFIFYFESVKIAQIFKFTILNSSIWCDNYNNMYAVSGRVAEIRSWVRGCVATRTL